MAAGDTFQEGGGIESPAEHALLVTPNDSVDLPIVSRALWIGTAGDLKVDMKGGQTLVFPGLTVGWHPLRVKRIYVTGTGAGGIVEVW